MVFVSIVTSKTNKEHHINLEQQFKGMRDELISLTHMMDTTEVWQVTLLHTLEWFKGLNITQRYQNITMSHATNHRQEEAKRLLVCGVVIGNQGSSGERIVVKSSTSMHTHDYQELWCRKYQFKSNALRMVLLYVSGFKILPFSSIK